MGDKMHSGIWDRFDFKAACLFTGYGQRKAPLYAELERVGLYDVKPMWQFPTPMDSILMRQITGRMAQHRGTFNSGMGHYRVIKTAYELGCGNCLVVEDDVRFLKDLNLLSDIVNDLPEDYDIALFDLFKSQKMPMTEVMHYINDCKASKYWRRFRNMRSFACYAMSRKAMGRFIRLFESAFAKKGSKLRVVDQYLRADRIGWDMKTYHAYPNAAIQVPMGTANSGSGYQIPFYKSIGVDPESYAK